MEIPRESGFWKPKFLKESVMLNQNFRGGWEGYGDLLEQFILVFFCVSLGMYVWH